MSQICRLRCASAQICALTHKITVNDETVGEIREKTVKIKEIREKKHLFRQNWQNLSPQQSNKLLIVITHIFC